MLNAKNLRQLRLSKILVDRYLGLFKVISIIGSYRQVYKLELPLTYRIHLVFYISMLKPYHYCNGVALELLKLINVNGQEYQEVEAILAHRDRNRYISQEYYVKWKGFSLVENSQELKANFIIEELVNEYEERLGDARIAPQMLLNQRRGQLRR